LAIVRCDDDGAATIPKSANHQESIMDRRQFLTTSTVAAAAGAAISLPINTTQAAGSPEAKPPAGASKAPAILASYTADDHRRRLKNVAACTQKIRKCMRKHLITDYLPAQCVYNIRPPDIALLGYDRLAGLYSQAET
jgi:hypothetical protein